MRFEERYVVVRATMSDAQPAWVCRCGDEQFVRTEPAGGDDGGGGSDLTMLRELRHTIAVIRELANAQRDMAVDLPERASSIVSLMEQSPLVGILAADDRAMYVAANAAACDLTGYTGDEILGMNIWDLLEESAIQKSQGLWRRFLRNGRAEGAIRLRLKTGELISALFVASANVLPGVHLSAMSPLRLDRDA